MKNRFYVSFELDWDYILLRYIEDGVRHSERIKLKPALYIPSASDDPEYYSYDGKPVMRIDFDSVKEARDFAKSYEGVPNFKVYGTPLFHYAYVHEHFKNQKPDQSQIRILNFDIETSTDGGYPNFQLADKEINAITLKMFKEKDIYVLGFKDYRTETPELLEMLESGYKIHYKKCSDEKELLRCFVEIWQRLDPDVVTGWNISGFDVPYIIKRIKYNFDEEFVKKLSPFGKINQRTVTIFNRETDIYDIVGVQRLDYMELYKKFHQNVEESYSLNYLSQKILEKTKLDYSQYGTLDKLYKQAPNIYIDYNIIDVIRVEEIDDAVRYMDVAFEIAYEALTNFSDSFTTIRNWDTMSHNFLIEQNRVIPYSSDNRKERQIAGGFVKEPILGKHKWVMSFDFKSLYPHLCMTFNISPDTYMGSFKPIFGEMSVQKILEGGLEQYSQVMADQDVTITGCGTVYSRKKKGFIPELMESLFEKRTLHQKEETKWEKKAAKGDKEAEKLSTIYENKSTAIKLLLNSGYGAFSNEWYRLFHDNIAESFTLSGQLAIKFVSSWVNTRLNKALETQDVDYIVAIDTDSFYLKLDEVVERFGGDKDPVDFLEDFSDTIQTWIREALEELYRMTNAFQKKLFMGLEAIGPAIWLAKKRYVMSLPSFKRIRYDPPKIKVMGIEAVRSTTPQIAREWIKDGIPMVINGSTEEIKKFIDDKWETFASHPFEDIAMPKGTNDLEKYSNRESIYSAKTPIHVRGALLFNDYVKKNGWESDVDLIKSGDKIKVMYLKMPNPIMENVISIPENMPSQFKIFEQYADYNKQFDKVFYDAFKRLTDAAGINLNSNTTMESFYE